MSVLAINHSRIIHDTIEGEVVIINLESGNYYTMNDSGAVIWALVQGGVPQAQIATELATYFGVQPEQAQAGTKTFCAALLSEGLVSETIQPNQAANANASLPPRGTYAAPHLSVFTDMQELLLLDPVHETSEQGWPHVKPAA